MSHQPTNFDSLCLPDQSPFGILSRPRAQPDACTALAQRKKLKAAALRVNKYSDSGRATDSDKTGRIVGRRNAARSQ